MSEFRYERNWSDFMERSLTAVSGGKWVRGSAFNTCVRALTQAQA